MRKHPLRKFFGLFVIYTAVIIGIFVLQFKTQSIISQSLGELSVTLYQNEDENRQLHLKNQIYAEYKGIVFSSDEEKTINGVKDGRPVPLTLLRWEKKDSSISFYFEEGASISFYVNPNASISEKKSVETTIETVPFSIVADTGDRFDSITIPYRFSSNTTVDSISPSRVVLYTKNGTFAFYAGHFKSDRVILSSHGNMAFLEPYNPVHRFTFDMLSGLAGTDSDSYENAVRQLRLAAVSRISAALSSSNLTENEVAVYIAEMISKGKYADALNAVPASFMEGTKRTYFTAPYFGNLVSTNESLSMQNDTFSSLVDNAIESGNADIFTIDGIIPYILMNKKTQKIMNLFSMTAAAKDFDPDLMQASSLLELYAALYSEQEFAELLKSAAEKSIAAIEDCCTLNDGIFKLTYNGKEAQPLLYAQSARALLCAGKVMNRTDLENAGHLFANTALYEILSLDSRTVASIYPVLVDNKYYPHAEILGYYGSQPVWAWTCSSLISYSIDEEDAVNISVDFPLGLTHYITFTNIPTFHSNIEMQGIPFRTDPRFETYNSSGYVYKESIQTLFIKSRHKNQSELIKLFCDKADNFSGN